MWDNKIEFKINDIVSHAISNTEYYAKVLKSNLFYNKDQFEKIPFLEKSEIRKDYKPFISKGTLEDECSIYYTSGTTGIPVKYIRTQKEKYDAFIEMAKERKRWSRNAFNGTIAHFDRIKEPLQYIYKDHKKMQLIFSLYNNSIDRFALYAAAIKEFEPTILQGYTSTLFQFAQYVIKENITLPKIELIETRSEHVNSIQKEILKQAFKGEVVSFYGLAELFPLAYECKEGRLHVCSDSVYIEVVSQEEGDSVVADEFGEIVVTSLKCKTMPLIRYKTGDIGSLSTQSCSCGMTTPVLKLAQGRASENIITPEGTMNAVVIRRIFNQMYKDDLSAIAQIQFIQEGIYEFSVNAVPQFNAPLENAEGKLSELIRSCFPYDINLTVNWTERLQPHPVTGKVNTFISNVRVQS